MTARRLKWVKAAPCNGVVYSMHAWLKIDGKDVKFSIAKMTSNGEDKFMVWRGDACVGLYADRVEALKKAEEAI